MLHRYEPRGRAERFTLGVLGFLAVLSVIGYARFGRFHEYGRFGHHTYHYHDVYHYAFGAKYFRELGYYGIYEATYVALDELAQSGARETPARFIPSVRSLEAPLTYQPVARVREAAPEIRGHFTPERWASFRDDLGTLLDLGWEVPWWRAMFFDLGFNPPPSWVVASGTLANLIPFTPTTFELFPFIDLLLVIGAGGWLLWRAFGPAPALGYLILFGNNYIASYVWTGGSFCRQPWLFLLVGGLACLRLERPRWAGALLGMSAAFRVFPLLFLAGGAVALVARAVNDRTRWRALVEYLAAAAAIGSILVGASLVLYGVEPWRDFLAKISLHNRIYWVMHIGFPRLAAYAPEIAKRDFWYETGLARFTAWQEQLQAVRAAREPWISLVQGMAVVAGFGLATRLRPCQAALVAGGTALFFTAMPANYYYIYLALFPVVFFTSEARATDAVRVLGAFALLVLIALCPLASRDDIVQNAGINASVGAYFVLLLLTISWDERTLFSWWWRRRSTPLLSTPEEPDCGPTVRPRERGFRPQTGGPYWTGETACRGQCGEGLASPAQKKSNVGTIRGRACVAGLSRAVWVHAPAALAGSRFVG